MHNSLPNRLHQVIRLLLYVLIIYLFIIIFLIIATMLSVAFNGSPMADDYYALHAYHNNKGLYNAFESLLSTSRYTQSITSSLVYGVLGNASTVIMPVIVILWFNGLSYLYLRRITDLTSLSKRQKKTVCLAGGLMLVALIAFINRSVFSDGTWFLYQDFFFVSAIVTYTIGFLATMSFLYYYIFHIKRPYSIRSLALFGVIIFILGLYNEVLPLSFAFIAVFAGIISLIIPLLSCFRVLAIVTAISFVASLTVMFFSPARASRTATIGVVEDYNVVEVLIRKFIVTLHTSYFRPSDIVLGACVAVTLVIGYIVVTNYSVFQKKHLLLLAIFSASAVSIFIGSLLISLLLIIVGYGPSSAAHQRTLLIPQIAYLLTLIFTPTLVLSTMYSFISRKYRRFLPAAILLTLFVSICVLTVTVSKVSPRIISQLRASRNYDAMWEKYNNKITWLVKKSDGHETIRLPDGMSGIGDGHSLRCEGPHSSSTIWHNNLIEAYYGISEVCSDRGTPL